MPAWFEFIFVTPSHHRVHHARNPLYIDKNYGGMLIIWDRLFGTFQLETEEPVYGLVHPLQTFSPVRVQFHHLLHVLKTFYSAPGIGTKLAVLFRPPSYDWPTGRYIHAPPIDPKHQKYDPDMEKGAKLWLALNFFLLFMGPIVVFLRVAPSLPYWARLAGSTVVLFGLNNLARASDASAPFFNIAVMHCVVLALIQLYTGLVFGVPGLQLVVPMCLLSALATGYILDK